MTVVAVTILFLSQPRTGNGVRFHGVRSPSGSSTSFLSPLSPHKSPSGPAEVDSGRGLSACKGTAGKDSAVRKEQRNGWTAILVTSPRPLLALSGRLGHHERDENSLWAA